MLNHLFEEDQLPAKIADRDQINISIAAPNGIKGDSYLHFVTPDWIKNIRNCCFGGRELTIDEIPASGKRINLLLCRKSNYFKI